jgi:ABC-type molybdate transport system ATPase subunit
LLARITCRSADALQLHAGQQVWLQVKSVALVL